MSRANRDYRALNKRCQNQQKTTRSINIIEINTYRPENHHLRAPRRHLLLVDGRDSAYETNRAKTIPSVPSPVRREAAAVLADIDAQ
jgi:hypothetical protein